MNHVGPWHLTSKIVSSEDAGKYERRKIAYCTDRTDHRVTAWLLIPHSARDKAVPAVLCLHQTTRHGKDEPAGLAGDPKLHYAQELAERGFVTMSPDYPSLGEYQHDFANDDYASGSMQALVDNRRAVDLLEGLAEVCATRIGCIGHSLGGHNSIFSAIFDDRLRVVVSCCGFTRFHRYYEGDLTGWSGERYMPRIGSWYDNDPNRVPFDFPELIASLAPRPFMAVAPTDDSNFDVGGVRDCIEQARFVYGLYHRRNVLVARYPDAAHSFPDADRQAAYDFLAHHLR